MLSKVCNMTFLGVLFLLISIFIPSFKMEKLRELGYAFNEDGCLRKIDSTGKLDKPFDFKVTSSQAENQKHYEEVAAQIPEIVYDLLEQNGLARTYVPENIPKEEATFIFTQPKKLNRSDKLLVLIHGSGFVRAGQWARSLIINNSLAHGTQLPYIKKARALGYDILITNTNDNYRLVNGVTITISNNDSPSAHAAYIWEKYVIGSNPESVAIVAHSYGGTVTIDLAKRFSKFFKEKVFAVALTDSAHFVSGGDDTMKLLTSIACNWVSSEKPLDSKISSSDEDIPRVSAGHSKHEWTSYSAMSSVFEFLENKYKSFTRKRSEKKPKLDL